MPPGEQSFQFTDFGAKASQLQAALKEQDNILTAPAITALSDAITDISKIIPGWTDQGLTLTMSVRGHTILLLLQRNTDPTLPPVVGPIGITARTVPDSETVALLLPSPDKRKPKNALLLFLRPTIIAQSGPGRR